MMILWLFAANCNDSNCIFMYIELSSNSIYFNFTLNTAAWGEPNSINGGLPVAISTIVQPRDQISAYYK